MRGSFRRVFIAIAVVAMMVAMAPGSYAVSPLPITCTAAGTVAAVDGGPVDSWSLAGKGSCQGDLTGTYFVDFVGTGTSKGLGLCDGSLVVADLNIFITGTMTSFHTGATVPFAQRWHAPLTTYPLGTPFLVSAAGGEVGAGAFFNHIFLNCQGSPAAQFTWTRTT